MEEPKNIAIIGAGPASLYGAGKLAKAGHNVVIINRDIKPGGLAEYGIYLNKYKMKKGLRKMFSRILADDRVQYFGNVVVGSEGSISLEDIEAAGFDAVVVAVGAQGTKWLGLPGEEAEAVFHAKDLVYHYNNLPPYSEQDFAVGQDVAVIGFGNVALDIVHWLVCERKVASATLVARRGPAERASTPKEIKLVSAAIDTDQVRAEIDAISSNLLELGQDIQEITDDLLKYVDEPLETESDTAFRMRFLRSPSRIEVDGDGNVTALTCEITRMTPPKREGGRPGVERTGEFEEIPCDTVIFAIGDSIEPSIGLPLEPKWKSTFAVVPDVWEAAPEAPRYMVYDPEREEPLYGTFVIGWARVASDGLVGKARADAETGCEEIMAYLRGELGPALQETPTSIEAVNANLARLFEERGVNAVDLEGIGRIEAAEASEASERGLPEFKFHSNAAMLAIAGSEGR